MRIRKTTYIHIFIWLFAVFANLPYSQIKPGMPPVQIATSTIAFLYLMFIFYLFYLSLAPLFLNRKNLTGFFVISFFVVLIMPFFGYSILFIIRAFFEGTFHHFFKGYSVGMHMSGFLPVLTAAVFGSFFRIIINWIDVMNQKAELDKQKLTFELHLLKSKLNPHFLFNTLNNIDSLIHNDTEKASVALIRLSEMMRYLTYETASEVVELEREIDYIRNLIELYRLRIKNPEEIRFEVSGDTRVFVSPALFVPLIENAFKFVIFRGIIPSVDIRIATDKKVIIFEISNYYDKDSSVNYNKNSGYGITNLKKRLELEYPDNYQLKIEKDDQQFHVKLTVNTNGN